MSIGFFMFGVCLFFFFVSFLFSKIHQKSELWASKRSERSTFLRGGGGGAQFHVKDIVKYEYSSPPSISWSFFFNFYFLKKVGLKSAGLFIYFEGLCTFDDVSLISSHTRLSRISAITSVSYPSSQSAALFWTLLFEPQTRNDSLLM